MIKEVHVFFGSEDDATFGSNSYVVVFDNLDALIVDPSFKNSIITKYLKKNKFKPIGVLLTHGHFDHFQGLPYILKKYNLPVYIGREDVICIGNKDFNLSALNESPLDHIEIKCIIKDVIDGPISIEGHALEVVHTPFHTLGSVCYYFPEDKVVFTGDTLMKGSIGRFDLKHAAPRQVKESLLKLCNRIGDSVTIYPGHDALTTMLDEKEHNMFLKRFLKGGRDEKNQ